MKTLEDIGIKLNWSFVKVSSSFLVEPSVGTIYCDLGGQLTAGIIDPHGRGHQSATAAVAAMPHLVLNHLLGPINQSLNSGQTINCSELEFTFAVSRNHWDGLCCFVLCDHLVRTGKLPLWSAALVESANLVDHGKVVLSENHSTAPLLLFYALNSKHKDRVEEVFPECKKIIEMVGSSYAQAPDFSINPFLSALSESDGLGEELLELGKYNVEDFSAYRKDLEKADTFPVALPFTGPDGDFLEEKQVNCLMFLEPPTSRLFVHWSRYKGDFDLLVVPSFMEKSKIIKRWQISVNPKSNLNLRRLGYLLEKEEKRAREGNDSRSGNPRWGDYEYSDNPDPWYDGRDHDYTLVDSPRDGTMLQDPAFIKSMLRSRFYGVSLKSQDSGKQSKARLLNYLFFEADSFQKPEGQANRISKPFQNLTGAYTYIKDISFLEINGDDLDLLGSEFTDYQWRVYVSEVTQHAVLEIETSFDTNDAILEDIKVAMEKCGQESVVIGKVIAEALGLKSNIWGGLNFSLLLFIDPDLNFHDDEKLRRLFGNLTNSPVGFEEVQALKIRPKGNDLISSSASVCVLRQSGTERLDENRRLIAFYALFIKTAYRRFSQRLAPLTKMDDIGNALGQIQAIQSGFSRFLASYDFSGTEISMDGGVTAFFSSMSRCLSLDEQKKETNNEIQLIGNLASSLENQERVEYNKKLSLSIFLLSLLAVCDFLYAFSTDLNDNYLEAVPRVGLTGLFVALIGFSGLAFLKRRSRFQKQKKKPDWE